MGKSFFSNPSCISSKHTFFYDEDDYLKKYATSYEKNEYIFALLDGSFVQIHYEFEQMNRRKIFVRKQSLAYLPSVDNGKLRNSYIRIDYDYSNSASFFHSAAHMHIGFDDQLRIPFDDVILLSEFFELIAYCYYPELFKSWKANGMPHTCTYKCEQGRFTKKAVIADEIRKNTYILCKER